MELMSGVIRWQPRQQYGRWRGDDADVVRRMRLSHCNTAMSLSIYLFIDNCLQFRTKWIHCRSVDVRECKNASNYAPVAQQQKHRRFNFNFRTIAYLGRGKGHGPQWPQIMVTVDGNNFCLIAMHPSTGNILLHITLIIHYYAAHDRNIRINVEIYWIIYAVVWYFRNSWLPVVNSNRYWKFWHSFE